MFIVSSRSSTARTTALLDDRVHIQDFILLLIQPCAGTLALVASRAAEAGKCSADPAVTPWTSLQLRELTLPHRVWLSPMCQYSADDHGAPTSWHLAHYGARAAGGVGLVMVEATAVAPDMRTTTGDLGLWSQSQVEAHHRLAGLISSVGSVPAVQLGLAGRKGSHGIPWDNTGTRNPLSPDEGGWQPLAPSPLPFAGFTTLRSMTTADIDRVLGDLERAARNAHRAGYQALGLQASNGYLFHQFLSPLANERTDAWGGNLEARMRFPLAVISALRTGWPAEKPLLIRTPVTDLLENGITTDDTTLLVARMAEHGADLIDINAGALVPDAPRPPTLGEHAIRATAAQPRRADRHLRLGHRGRPPPPGHPERRGRAVHRPGSTPRPLLGTTRPRRVRHRGLAPAIPPRVLIPAGLVEPCAHRDEDRCQYDPGACRHRDAVVPAGGDRCLLAGAGLL